eukprot:GHVT01019695.1.p2 GENE.GHVT01019695.1~~GHVT01019695.1.p2  ORF type:complete len:123 (+),score=14.97 GHVT01019695.1:563-931(+)
MAAVYICVQNKRVAPESPTLRVVRRRIIKSETDGEHGPVAAFSQLSSSSIPSEQPQVVLPNAQGASSSSSAPVQQQAVQPQDILPNAAINNKLDCKTLVKFGEQDAACHICPRYVLLTITLE